MPVLTIQAVARIGDSDLLKMDAFDFGEEMAGMRIDELFWGGLKNDHDMFTASAVPMTSNHIPGLNVFQFRDGNRIFWPS